MSDVIFKRYSKSMIFKNMIVKIDIPGFQLGNEFASKCAYGIESGKFLLPDSAPLPTTKRDISNMIENMKRIADLYQNGEMRTAATTFEKAFKNAKSTDLSGILRTQKKQID